MQSKFKWASICRSGGDDHRHLVLLIQYVSRRGSDKHSPLHRKLDQNYLAGVKALSWTRRLQWVVKTPCCTKWFKRYMLFHGRCKWRQTEPRDSHGAHRGFMEMSWSRSSFAFIYLFFTVCHPVLEDPAFLLKSSLMLFILSCQLLLFLLFLWYR